MNTVPKGTALVPLTPSARRAAGARSIHAHSIRPSADFLAQLIATAAHAPQTCARRRAGPDEASAFYRALDKAPATVGATLSRSL
jgi:hypothetical protein